jgi:hypothetical protein
MIAFPQHMDGQAFESNRHLEKITAEMLIPEDGDDERRKASEY